VVRRRRWGACIAAALACSLAVFSSGEKSVALAADLVRPEYEVKATWLYQFSVLTEWPKGVFATAKSPLRISVLGKDPFGAELDKIAGKTVDAHKIVVQRSAAVADLKDSQIVFISATESDHLPAILAELAGQPVLTVSDMPEFSVQGGMIGLVKLKIDGEEKLRPEINTNAVNRAKLVLSSKLYRVAIFVSEPVQKNPPPAVAPIPNPNTPPKTKAP
jgi:hypothetical protein